VPDGRGDGEGPREDGDDHAHPRTRVVPPRRYPCVRFKVRGSEELRIEYAAKLRDELKKLRRELNVMEEVRA
jgi:hypothetical protein